MNALVLVVSLVVAPSVFEGRGLLTLDPLVKDQPVIPAMTRDCQLASDFGRFVNHCSLKPTAYIDSSGLWLRALTDLESLTELTINYNESFAFLTPRGTVCGLKPAERSFRQC